MTVWDHSTRLDCDLIGPGGLQLLCRYAESCSGSEVRL